METVSQSRADLISQYREWLVHKMGGSEVLADAQLRIEMEAAATQRARESELRAELARLDIGLAAHNAKTAFELAPLRVESQRLHEEAVAADVRVENARIAREADGNARFRNRRNEIREELGRQYAPAYKPLWRAARQ
jgi:hypothetical protein